MYEARAIETVLVDIDTTLTDEQPRPAGHLPDDRPSDPLARILMRTHGVPADDARRRVREAMDGIVEMIGNCWPFGAHKALGISDELLWDQLTRDARAQLFMHPDAEQFLRELRRIPGLRVFTATTNPRLIILAKLSIVGLADCDGSPCLDDAFGGEEVSPGGKCGPAFYHAILQRTAADPATTLMVGDNDLPDRTYARQAGIRHVAIVRRAQPEPLRIDTDGTWLVNRLTELLPVIGAVTNASGTEEYTP